MSNYSYNLDRQDVVFAKLYDVNVSYKSLNAVCNAIRYRNVSDAMKVLDQVIAMEMPILYKRYSKKIGARSELGGRKGRYPQKAAKEVKKVLENAVANAGNKGLSGESMFVVHASSNKTVIVRRNPSRGSLAWGRGMYGRSSINHSDIEYAKIEIGIADVNDKLSGNMRYFIKKNSPSAKKASSKSTQKKADIPKKEHRHDDKAAAPKKEEVKPAKASSEPKQAPESSKPVAAKKEEHRHDESAVEKPKE